DSKQASFFSDLPDESANRELGGIYTPHYIARFFARFLKENLTPPLFRSLKLADPACGSGIFLRTTLEMQCDPLQDIDIHAVAGQAFQNVLGIDVEETACQATRLSLSLLHLVLTGSFPSALRIESAEVIEYYAKHLGLKEAYDAVVTNPPFIKWDAVPEDWRQRISKFMATEATGKIDLFLALLKVGLEMVKPGGFLLYVLPHSFLIARNAAKLRQRIAAEFWVRVIVDLSEIPVFGDVGAYVVLLILQKKPRHAAEEPLAAVVHCRGYVGFALQSALEGKRTTSDFYSIHDTSQATFRAKTWQVPPPSQQGLAAALRRFTRLDDFLIVREGFVTGADDVFIRRRADAPPGEEKAYRPFLHDREMGRYRVPKNTKEVVFYPFENDRRLEATEVRKRFPATWAFLGEHKKLLQERASVRAKTVEWWCPERPRSPENMLRPKLVSPHLILLPRFSFDETGQYAISHSPLLYPRDPSSQTDFLLYFLAVLNSSVAYWQIAMLSHKYSRGYAMLEPKTLKELRIPPPAEVHPSRMKRLLALVRRRLDNSDAQDLELDIDRVVADLYGLSTTDRIEIGMER
ncbi:MAG: N-6 DNA methylase, partial [bacterium]